MPPKRLHYQKLLFCWAVGLSIISQKTLKETQFQIKTCTQLPGLFLLLIKGLIKYFPRRPSQPPPLFFHVSINISGIENIQGVPKKCTYTRMLLEPWFTCSITSAVVGTTWAWKVFFTRNYKLSHTPLDQKNISKVKHYYGGF